MREPPETAPLAQMTIVLQDNCAFPGSHDHRLQDLPRGYIRSIHGDSQDYTGVTTGVYGGLGIKGTVFTIMYLVLRVQSRIILGLPVISSTTKLTCLFFIITA